jgi:hypothetical protein
MPTDASFRPHDAVWDGIITASSVSKEPAPVECDVPPGVLGLDGRSVAENGRARARVGR